MRLVIGAALLLMPTSAAMAGGIGIIATGGVHSERFFYYSSRSPEGALYNDPDDYDQFALNSLLPQGGGGLELVLGDRDDRIVGSFRLFYNGELPPGDIANLQGEVDPADVVVNVRDEIRHLGFAMIGLSWGLVGDPGGFQLTAVGHVGTAFLTTDHTEHFAAQIGPGVAWRLTRQVQFAGDVQYQFRLQKRPSHAVIGTLGLRYLFD